MRGIARVASMSDLGQATRLGLLLFPHLDVRVSVFSRPNPLGWIRLLSCGLLAQSASFLGSRTLTLRT